MLRPLTLLLAVLAVVAMAGAGCARGPGYPDEDAFTQAMAAEGWVVVGRFGAGWPARISEDAQAYGSIAFVTADGQRHEYGGFEGYDMRVVHLAGPGGVASVRVLRSQELTGIVGDELR